VTPVKFGSIAIGGIRSGRHAASEGRTCWTKPPKFGLFAPVSADRPLKVKGGLKSPKIVKAAVRPVLVMASSLSGARPPPVAGSSAVKLKLVGVDRDAREI
jgi:hypothetical protein